MDKPQRQLKRVRNRLGPEQFRRVAAALENLSTYHEMQDREDVEFVQDAEPPELGVILELIDELYNPFSTSRGAFSTTDDVLLAIRREYNMRQGYELSLSSRNRPSKTQSIINTIDYEDPDHSSLQFIKRRENGKVRYRHPASSISISETTFFELNARLKEEYGLSPAVMDSYLSFVSDETTTQTRLTSFK
jgi:hypothetical protein